jgi:hypothetical protein
VSRLSTKNIDGDEVAQNKLWDYYAMLRSCSFLYLHAHIMRELMLDVQFSDLFFAPMFYVSWLVPHVYSFCLRIDGTHG